MADYPAGSLRAAVQEDIDAIGDVPKAKFLGAEALYLAAILDEWEEGSRQQPHQIAKELRDAMTALNELSKEVDVKDGTVTNLRSRSRRNAG